METSEKPKIFFTVATVHVPRYGELIASEKRALPRLQKELNEDALWYDNENATDTLLKNPDTPFEKLEGDTITVTAEFKDGQQATKKIKTSFNSKGELQLQYVK